MGERFYGRVLDQLFDERVLRVKKMGAEFVFSEECDSWFGCKLSAQDVRDLAQELLDNIGEKEQE